MPLLNDRNFEQDIKSGVAVVNFSSLWNMDSRAFEQNFKQLSEDFKGRAKFIVSDVNANQILARNESVTSIPTVVIYVNGAAVARITGVTKRQVREAVEHFLRKA